MTHPPPSDAESPVFDRLDRSRPRVVQPSSPWTVVLGLGGAVLVGLAAFGSLSHARQAHAQAAAPVPAVQRQYAASTPPAAAPAPMAESAALPPAPMSAAEPQPDLETPRLHAPAVVVELGDGGAPAAPLVTRPAMSGAAPPPPEDTRLSAEERFVARVTSTGVDTAHATRLRDLARTAPQGTVIAAVLETAINSDLPGSVRAVVSRDVRGFDGREVLIPRGSKLIGQYKSAVAVGQTRAFVIWSRILTPQGVSIAVDSPGTDRLGRGGLDGETDTHFFRRFGAAILLTVMSIGLDAAASHNGSGNTFVIASPVQANRVAEIALQKQIDIPATIKVAQGTPLQVFVSRDLDFSGVAP